jgi:hypothetical protein
MTPEEYLKELENTGEPESDESTLDVVLTVAFLFAIGLAATAVVLTVGAALGVVPDVTGVLLT